VIRFKCIYCGQRILAPDNGADKRGKCPKCNHMLVVPKTTKGRPAISVDIPEQLQQARETVAMLSTTQDLPEDIAELYREKAGWFIPTYDELSLFLMAATFILLGATNATMREQIYKGITVFHDLRVYIMVVIFLGGIILSSYHVFTTREKTKFEKTVMLFFAVAANAGTGIISGWYVIKNSDVHNWQLVFPIWNIINGALLLLMLRFRIIDEECISDREATLVQIILGLASVLIIFIFCNYVFDLYWAITFSICIVYTTSFDKALQNVFPGLTNREDEQPS
jgi:DNA-directed RNA polymerase subunit RPC12/RpoP